MLTQSNRMLKSLEELTRTWRLTTLAAEGDDSAECLPLPLRRFCNLWMGRSRSRLLLAPPPRPEADERVGIQPPPLHSVTLLLPLPPPPPLQLAFFFGASAVGFSGVRLNQSEDSGEVSNGGRSLSVDGSGRRTSERWRSTGCANSVRGRETVVRGAPRSRLSVFTCGKKKTPQSSHASSFAPQLLCAAAHGNLRQRTRTAPLRISFGSEELLPGGGGVAFSLRDDDNDGRLPFPFPLLTPLFSLPSTKRWH